MLGERATHRGCMAKKRGSGVAPYVALLVAVIIFVPPVRGFFADLVAPLVQLVQDSFQG
ncbi:hypothetical protein K7G98_05320 [Saccharothrix sp. MB29]|nr:hypothetical protein [Saccharothrix sp. MB29]